MQQKILFIGGGNMAQAIIQGLIANNYEPQLISVLDSNLDKCDFLSQSFKINANNALSTLPHYNDIIILAVKPQVAEIACTQLNNIINHNTLIISVMAGITTNKIASFFQQDKLAVIRAMPNTPAAIQAGATGLSANSNTSNIQKQYAETIFNAIGITAWVNKEDDINIITALSGSGPAYAFYVMEHLAKAAVKFGLDNTTANDFIIQTFYGAAKLAKQSNDSLNQLRQNVTSNKGTTDAAIKTMEQLNIDQALEKAIQNAVNRAVELSQT